jgi:hypothetical protein
MTARDPIPSCLEDVIFVLFKNTKWLSVLLSDILSDQLCSQRKGITFTERTHKAWGPCLPSRRAGALGPCLNKTWADDSLPFLSQVHLFELMILCCYSDCSCGRLIWLPRARYIIPEEHPRITSSPLKLRLVFCGYYLMKLPVEDLWGFCFSN